MRLGVLGGTFNPVHYGHLRAAEEVRQLLHFDKVLFVPSGTPPLKESGLAPIEFRSRMVEMAIAGNPYFGVSNIELDRSGPSYTVDTVKELNKNYTGHELFFILGADAFSDLPKWKEPDELLSSIDFVIVERPAGAFSAFRGTGLLHMGPEDLRYLGQEERTMVEVPTRGGHKAVFVRIPFLDISATMVRKHVQEGRSIKYLLPEDVELFIISHGLYKDR